MRKFATGLLALTALALFAIPASATVLLSEGFPYADGTGLLTVGWVATGTNTGVDITVTSGRAIGDCANAPDDNKAFATQGTTAPTYVCFEVMIPDPGSSPKTVYFAHLSDGGSSNFFARVYVTPAGNTFTFAVSYSSTSTSVGIVPWGPALSYGVSYRVVVKYDPVAKSATLWVNPTSEADPSVSQTGTTTAVAMSAFCLRQSSTQSTLPSPAPTGTANFKFSVDNVGVGTTFNDACYQITPTRNSTWGQVKVLYR